MTHRTIRLEGIGKRYSLGEIDAYKTLRDALATVISARAWRRENRGAPDPIVWALKDISLAVSAGEIVGIIGRNGAGKSTLLKILSRIAYPTEGWGEINGRVGTLLEVGTGFHPELTGRENVYLNGAILGMTRTEIRRKFDEIVEFSGVERFLDTPVKRYSSGMYVRLAFAVAAHLETEILLVDEVLAVGDATFQRKCLGKMGTVADAGRTVFLVSHNMAAIQSLCTRAILLEEGKIRFDGDPVSAVALYFGDGVPRGKHTLQGENCGAGAGRAGYTALRVLDEEGRETGVISMGRPFALEFQFVTRGQTLKAPGFGVQISSATGQSVVRIITRETHGAMPPARRGGAVRLKIDDLNLMPGMYYLTLGLSDRGEQIELLEDAIPLEIVPAPVYATGKIPAGRGALVFARCSWTDSYE